MCRCVLSDEVLLTESHHGKGLSHEDASVLKMGSWGTSLMVQWPRFHAPNVGGTGSIPDQGTRSHMLQLRPRIAKLKKKKWAHDIISLLFHIVTQWKHTWEQWYTCCPKLKIRPCSILLYSPTPPPPTAASTCSHWQGVLTDSTSQTPSSLLFQQQGLCRELTSCWHINLPQPFGVFLEA